MGWSRIVLLVAWEGERPRCPDIEVREIPVEGIPAAIAPGSRPSVLVLGDRALLLLRPESLRTRIRYPGCIALAAPRESTVERIALWSRSMVAEPVSPRNLEERICQAAQVPVRLEVPLAAWVPRRASSDAVSELILSSFPALWRPTVEDLAGALQWERHRLCDHCWRVFGVPTSELLWRYTDAVVRMERWQGWTVETVALSLGKSNPRCLWRLYRDRGVRFPGVGEELPWLVTPDLPNCSIPSKVSH